MAKNRSIDFFEAQFQGQVAVGARALNPFEALALPYVSGRVLDLGCGLGNFSIEAARRGCPVIALDGSPTAIVRLREAAASEHLPIHAEQVDLATYRIADTFDTIVAIGLLMFFPRRRALALLDDIVAHVWPGGYAIVNVLVHGTTYFDMFEPGQYYLFAEHEVDEHFIGWNIVESRLHRFEAPGATVKAFATVVAQRRQ
jgi:tellurite methyltransferase